MSGVLISAFAKGMRDGGFVAVSDAAGRFFLLVHSPGGVHACGPRATATCPRRRDRSASCADQDSIFSITLKALEELSDADVRTGPGSCSGSNATSAGRFWRSETATARRRRDGSPTAADLAESLSPWLRSLEVVADPRLCGYADDRMPAEPRRPTACPRGRASSA